MPTKEPSTTDLDMPGSVAMVAAAIRRTWKTFSASSGTYLVKTFLEVFLVAAAEEVVADNGQPAASGAVIFGLN